MTNGGSGEDLRAYLRGSGPLSPHRAAQLVASLAEHLAAVHAGGRAYLDLDAGAVRVTATGQDVSGSFTAWAIPSSGAAVSANVRAVGVLLAELLGAVPAVGRPVGVPAVLWHVVESCTATDRREQPDAARLAGMLRDAERDLLLEVSPGAPVAAPAAAAAAAAAPKPGYLPNRDVAPAPPPRRSRPRWTGWALLACVLAVGLAGTGVLLPAAGLHLPFANGGSQTASWGRSAVSPTATSGADSATPSPTGPGAALGPTPDPSPSVPGPTPGGAPVVPAVPAAAEVRAAREPSGSAPAGATPSPEPSVTPPAGGPTPTPSPSWRTSAFHVTSGSSRTPIVRGELTWYNRSVRVSAAITSRSPCAAAVFTGYAGSARVARIAAPSRCGTITVSRNLDAHTIRGGITRVVIDLYVDGKRVGRDICLRRTAACTRA